MGSYISAVNLFLWPVSQVALVGKNPPANAGDIREASFDLWVRKFPWRRKWQPTPVFLPGKSHGQRSLVGYSPYGCKESDTTEVTQHAYTRKYQRLCFRKWKMILGGRSEMQEEWRVKETINTCVNLTVTCIKMVITIQTNF